MISIPSMPRLFAEGSLTTVLRARLEQVARDIRDLPDSAVPVDDVGLARSQHEWLKKYRVESPELDSGVGDIEQAQHESVSMLVPDFDRRLEVVGVRLRFLVPYRGESWLFRFPGNPAPMGSVRAALDEKAGRVVVTVDAYEETPEQIDAAFGAQLNEVVAHLRGLQQPIAEFDRSLKQTVHQALIDRQKRLAATKALVDALPYKRRT